MPRPLEQRPLEHRALEPQSIDQRVVERRRWKKKPGGSPRSPLGKSVSLPQLARTWSPAGLSPGSPERPAQRVRKSAVALLAVNNLSSSSRSRPLSPVPTEASRLAETMQRALKGGLSQSHISGADKALAQERESQALTIAVLKGDKGEIREALARAQKAGVSKTLVDSAKGQVHQLESFDLMARAIQSEDVVALKEAIAMARKSGAPKQDVTMAEDMLARIETRGRLREAISLRREESLRWAINEGEILGLQSVDDPVLSQAKEVLKELGRK